MKKDSAQTLRVGYKTMIITVLSRQFHQPVAVEGTAISLKYTRTLSISYEVTGAVILQPSQNSCYVTKPLLD